MSATATTVAVLALLAVVGLLAVVPAWLHGRRSRALGRAEVRTRVTGDILENVSKSQQSRGRLRGDAAYARRLRDRFTRRE